MSKNKQKQAPKVSYWAEALFGLVDGSSVFVDHVADQMCSPVNFCKEIVAKEWVETRSGQVIRGSQIVSLKQITWSEK